MAKNNSGNQGKSNGRARAIPEESKPALAELEILSQDFGDDADENRALWKFGSEMPAWLAGLALAMIVAMQFLIASAGDITVALRIAAAYDTGKMLTNAGVTLTSLVAPLLPWLLSLYWRNRLTDHFRDLNAARLSDQSLLNERLLTGQLRGGLVYVAVGTAAVIFLAPAAISTVVTILTVRNVAIGLGSNIMKPGNFERWLEEKKLARLPREKKLWVLETRTRASNLSRFNGAVSLTVMWVLIGYISGAAQGLVLPQKIRLDSNQVLVGAVLGETPTGISVLRLSPRSVVIIDPDRVVSTTYCTDETTWGEWPDETLPDVLQGNSRPDAPRCPETSQSTGPGSR